MRDAVNIRGKIYVPYLLIVLLLTLALCLACFLTGCSKSSSQDIAEGWGETQSLSVATDWAEIDFQSPDETFITNDGKNIELTTYRYKTSIVEALYKGEDYEVSFRRSDELSGKELSEDDRSYPNEWDVEINGISVHCLGNGKGVNAAYFDMDNDHYSVTADLGNDGTGLSEEDLSLFLKPVIKQPAA